MAGNKGDVIAEREQACADRADQLGMIAPREITAANGTGKEHITHHGKTGFGLYEYHMTRGVARAVQYVQTGVAHRDLITMFQPARGREGARRREAEHL